MPEDVDGCALVIAATPDKQVNSQVANAAKAGNVPVNVVDNPALCSFIMPSVVDRDPVQIAVSTGGGLTGPGPAVAGKTGNADTGNLRPAGDGGAGVPRPGKTALPGIQATAPVLGEYPAGARWSRCCLPDGKPPPSRPWRTNWTKPRRRITRPVKSTWSAAARATPTC